VFVTTRSPAAGTLLSAAKSCRTTPQESKHVVEYSFYAEARREMMTDQQKAPRRTFLAWLRELSRGPVVPNRGYFDRLRSSIESSAPVYRRCGC